MEIEFVCYATIRDAVGQKTVHRAVPDGGTVGEAVREFVADYEGLEALVFDSDGDVRSHVNVLHNGENVRVGEGLATPLEDGDTVGLAPGVSGGKRTTTPLSREGS